jgi:hypothetical protein
MSPFYLKTDNDKSKFTEYVLEFTDPAFTLPIFLSQRASKIELTGTCMHGLALYS